MMELIIRMVFWSSIIRTTTSRENLCMSVESPQLSLIIQSINLIGTCFISSSKISPLNSQVLYLSPLESGIGCHS